MTDQERFDSLALGRPFAKEVDEHLSATCVSRVWGAVTRCPVMGPGPHLPSYDKDGRLLAYDVVSRGVVGIDSPGNGPLVRYTQRFASAFTASVTMREMEGDVLILTLQQYWAKNHRGPIFVAAPTDTAIMVVSGGTASRLTRDQATFPGAGLLSAWFLPDNIALCLREGCVNTLAYFPFATWDTESGNYDVTHAFRMSIDPSRICAVGAEQ